MSRARHKCLQANGSRHGKKDALYVGLGVFDEADGGRFRTHMSCMVAEGRETDTKSKNNLFVFLKIKHRNITFLKCCPQRSCFSDGRGESIFIRHE